MEMWYLSKVGGSFTEILEAIAIEKGYREGDGKKEEPKQRKPRRRLQPLNLEPSACEVTQVIAI